MLVLVGMVWCWCWSLRLVGLMLVVKVGRLGVGFGVGRSCLVLRLVGLVWCSGWFVWSHLLRLEY